MFGGSANFHTVLSIIDYLTYSIFVCFVLETKSERFHNYLYLVQELSQQDFQAQYDRFELHSTEGLLLTGFFSA